MIRKSCKYVNVCGDKFNCQGCTGYEKIDIKVMAREVIKDVKMVKELVDLGVIKIISIN